jgi:hypothetical protein
VGDEGFQRRVQLLRDAWMERRELQGMAGLHDFEAQFALLATLYGWAATAVSDIRSVYENELDVRISGPPDADGPRPSFCVTLAETHSVVLELEDRRSTAGPRWFISMTVGADGAGVPAGPERRNGLWTRNRLEEILLSVLGSYERALSEGTRRDLIAGLRTRRSFSAVEHAPRDAGG